MKILHFIAALLLAIPVFGQVRRDANIVVTNSATINSLNSGIDAGANDTYVITLTPALAAYTTGATYYFKANTANTGAATININGLGAKTIVKVAGGITTALADNDIRAGQWVGLVYDGTNMQMQSLLGNAAAAAATLTSTQVGYGDGSNVLTGEAAFTYNATTNIATIGGVSLGAGSEVSTIGPLVDAVDGVTPLNNVLSAYGVGTAYPFTNTAAAIDFGTTDPVKVLTNAGTYLIFAQAHLAYNGATVVAETATIKVRRTNNTAADLSAVVVLDLPASTTLTNTYGIFQIPPFVYTTAAVNDSITIFANVSAALGVGTIDATAIGTSIVAMRLY